MLMLLTEEQAAAAVALDAKAAAKGGGKGGAAGAAKPRCAAEAYAQAACEGKGGWDATQGASFFHDSALARDFGRARRPWRVSDMHATFAAQL